jgi:hypothetical protein
LANLVRMRTTIPPPGRAMAFPEWSEAIVDGVRAYLPDARAVRKGSRLVIVRHDEREAHLVEDGGAFLHLVLRRRHEDDDVEPRRSRLALRAHDVDVGVLGCRICRRSFYARGRVSAQYRSAGRASRGQRLEIEPPKQQRARRRRMGR